MSREALFFILFLPLPTAFALDLCLGDPPWLYHPVRLMGWLITLLEKGLRALFPPTRRGERAAGIMLAFLLPSVFVFGSGVLLLVCWRIHPALWFAVETAWGYQLLAARSLWDESMAVYRRLACGDLRGARTAVGRIVGRDTEGLDTAGISRAAVETVAENTSDGVVAPLLFMALGGAALAMGYKAVNTLDSMVGYQNQRYLWFGRASAKLDDALNFLPARVSAGLMLLICESAGFNAKEAARVYRRDRRNHASPNSAHTEAVCAGALGLRLGGDSRYFGKLLHKPTIGDATRPIEPEDIRRANRLMLFTAFLALLAGCALRVGVVLLIANP